jgi:hypothetical protein
MRELDGTSEPRVRDESAFAVQLIRHGGGLRFGDSSTRGVCTLGGTTRCACIWLFSVGVRGRAGLLADVNVSADGETATSFTDADVDMFFLHARNLCVDFVSSGCFGDVNGRRYLSRGARIKASGASIARMSGGILHGADEWPELGREEDGERHCYEKW